MEEQTNKRDTSYQQQSEYTFFFYDGITKDILYIILILGKLKPVDIHALIHVSKAFNKTMKSDDTKKLIFNSMGESFTNRFKTARGVLKFLMDNLHVHLQYHPPHDITISKSEVLGYRSYFDPHKLDYVPFPNEYHLEREREGREDEPVYIFTLEIKTPKLSDPQTIFADEHQRIEASLSIKRMLSVCSDKEKMVASYALPFVGRNGGYSYCSTWTYIATPILDEIQNELTRKTVFGNAIEQSLPENSMIVETPFRMLDINFPKDLFISTRTDYPNADRLFLRPIVTRHDRQTANSAIIPLRYSRVYDDGYLDHPYFASLNLRKQ